MCLFDCCEFALRVVVVNVVFGVRRMLYGAHRFNACLLRLHMASVFIGMTPWCSVLPNYTL